VTYPGITPPQLPGLVVVSNGVKMPEYEVAEAAPEEELVARPLPVRRLPPTVPPVYPPKQDRN